MVFSSIKPEKRFSQWRGEGEKRRRAGTGRRSDTENKRFALPLVRVLRVEGREGEDGGGGEGARGERLHCVRLMRRDQGAETMHRTAMCCTDGHWTGLHTNTHVQRCTHLNRVMYSHCSAEVDRTKLPRPCW